jgi:hypothetical protein
MRALEKMGICHIREIEHGAAHRMKTIEERPRRGQRDVGPSHELRFQLADVLSRSAWVGRVFVDALVNEKRRVQPCRYRTESRSEHPQDRAPNPDGLGGRATNLMFEHTGIQGIDAAMSETRRHERREHRKSLGTPPHTA